MMTPIVARRAPPLRDSEDGEAPQGSREGLGVVQPQSGSQPERGRDHHQYDREAGAHPVLHLMLE